MALNECEPPKIGLELMPEPSVLVVEDDRDVAQTYRRFFEKLSGMKTSWARTGAEALKMKEIVRPDIVLVDLGLPDVDGGELVSWLAAKKDCGIIVVSGRGEETDRVSGLARGADDYITKPVSMREMVERIRAVHRRLARSQSTVSNEPAQVTLATVRVDLRRRTIISRDNTPIHLTAAEFMALEALIAAAPQPVSRDRLCKLALRRQFHAEDRGVDQLVLNLRRKLFDDEIAHSIIVSVRGAGYAIAIDKDLMQASK
jgi:DNA-binding response OmpR family regulator